MTNSKKFFACECECSIVAVDADAWDGPPRQIGMSMFRWGTNTYDTGWRSRWRHIKDIVRHGHPWADDVLLSMEDARRLGEHLIAVALKDETE